MELSFLEIRNNLKKDILFVTAGNGEEFPFSVALGIGLNEISIKLTEYILTRKNKPRKIIFLGTAGSYGKHKILDLIVTNQATQIELSFLENRSYTPLKSLINLPNTNIDIVNSSNYISTDFNLATQFLKMGITLENMEFFSVFQVAKYFNIDVEAVLVVTNFTNKNAHQDYFKNYKKALKKIEEFVKKNYPEINSG